MKKENVRSKIKYVMMGEDGFYTFEDYSDELALCIGLMTHHGFTLIGIDGMGGYKVVDKPITE